MYYKFLFLAIFLPTILCTKDIDANRVFKFGFLQNLKTEKRNFTLAIKDKNKSYIFLGKQFKNSCYLKSKDKNNNFIVEKKENNIIITVNNKREILPSQSFGIISPLEHLSLITKIGSNAKICHYVSFNKDVIGFIVNIDYKKLYLTLKNPNLPINAFKDKISYVFLFKKNKTLLKFYARIFNNYNSNITELCYSF